MGRVRPPWRFNHAEVNRVAREKFGVLFPIELRVRRRQVQPNGKHTVRLDTNGWHVWRADGVHEIMLCTGNGTYTFPVTRVLWVLAHELHHAWQSELYESPDAFSEAYAHHLDDKELNPFELDANAVSMLSWYHLEPTINYTKEAA